MRLKYVRELDEYPQGLRRWWILSMAVLATFIGSYEAQIAPVVPLLLGDLQMTLTTYGAVSAAATVSGAIAAAIGGRLTDHLGRVRLLVPLMLLTSGCCLAMTLVTGPHDLLLARVVLAFVDGMAMASTAPLVRDFSPRTGRAQAFGFWTWGPVGASLLAAGLAAWTLPIFAGSWRSQFVIMGAVSLVMSIVIALNIADLSPELRMRLQFAGRPPHHLSDRQNRPRARDLLAHRRIWAHMIGICLWLVLYLSLAMYGPTMLVDSFRVSTAEASAIMSAFWVFDLAVLIVVGRASDRLALRKPFIVGGTTLAAIVTGYLIVLMGRNDVSATHLMITGALLGAGLATAYGPWMASYSEDADDADARLQGTAWGVFGFGSRLVAVIVLLAVPVTVAECGWRAWFCISLIALVLFVPAVRWFGGPWRPGAPVSAAARRSRITVDGSGLAPSSRSAPQTLRRVAAIFIG